MGGDCLPWEYQCVLSRVILETSDQTYFQHHRLHFTLDNQSVCFCFMKFLSYWVPAEIRDIILRQLSFCILFMFYVGTNSELKWDSVHSLFIPSPLPAYLSCAPDNPRDLSTSLIWLLGFGNIATSTLPQTPQTQTQTETLLSHSSSELSVQNFPRLW